ncbi:MAG: carbamoyltransferase HypF [Selenomonadaceae bacterium]|nr:carbamoyltransferase HypF [Selenomonadaceae bacterium]
MTSFIIKIFGIVQGVGFRPFVARLAREMGLAGSVRNRGSYVELTIQCSEPQLDTFLSRLKNEAPERAAILKLDVRPAPSAPAAGLLTAPFSIIDSEQEAGAVFVSPDIAICGKCRREMYDRNSRRYLHPFINCTACGPRLTILKSMPYDRERTSMGGFPMCEECRREYTDPANRRYDAQPVCCPHCGPKVFILDGQEQDGEAITRIRANIIEGNIAAIKGLGGFHLVCSAADSRAVSALRQRKNRPSKPFALMMKDMDTISRECVIPTAETRQLLTGPQKPILLLERAAGCTAAEEVAPGNPRIGVMLPYTPLHQLLFDYPDGLNDRMPAALVMTSGNPSGAPICRTDEEAREYLLSTGIADTVLTNDRPILLRADDSVISITDNKPMMIRRSRGYAPLPVILSGEMKGTVLAIGSELKNAFCLAKDTLLYPSPYIGDMTDLRTAEALEESVLRMMSLLEINPDIIIADLHPRYNSLAAAKRLSEKLSVPLVQIQHHYAHILSCMADNDYREPVIGAAFDGTGYGEDGTIWGGEILRCDLHGFRRLDSIPPFLQPGGDSAARSGRKIAAALIQQGYSSPLLSTAGHSADRLVSPSELAAIDFQLKNNVNCVKSTSVGRLFDACAAMLGLKGESSFEGEAAMALEFAAAHEDSPAYRFHESLARWTAAACEKARETTRLSTVALSGGVFQNALLTRLTAALLAESDFRVLTHRQIPANDGGISVGQALHGLCILYKKQ